MVPKPEFWYGRGKILAGMHTTGNRKKQKETETYKKNQNSDTKELICRKKITTTIAGMHTVGMHTAGIHTAGKRKKQKETKTCKKNQNSDTIELICRKKNQQSRFLEA